MKKSILIALAAIVLIAAGSSTGYAFRGGHGGHGGHFRHGGHFGVGFYVGPGWGPWWGWPYYPYYPYYSSPPIVIEKEPDTYIQQDDQSDEPEGYWYFCRDPEGYYPYVKKCPKGWQKVLPTPDQEIEGEE